MYPALTFPLTLALLYGSVGAFPSAQNAAKGYANPIPPPPKPEPISLVTLPLPPIAPSDAVGACTSSINPHGTGCLIQNGSWASGTSFQAGNFLPDGHHIVALVNYTGAPAAPAPASIYSGPQIIILKTDGTTFKNGDSWKCITCGVPAQNKVGMSAALDYPQTFDDGRRLLVGTNVIDCHGSLIGDSCTPQKTFIYPLRWNATADGSGAGGSMRELRLHPDNIHLMFNTFGSSPSGAFGEYVFIARLDFNVAPKTGLPLAPRYDLGSVYLLVDPTAQPAITAVGKKLSINSSAIAVGEGRGFASRGAEVTQVGFPVESCNADLTAFDLTTGAWRRLTEHPEYADPMQTSPDGEWMVIEDTRGSGRQMFLSGMRYVPPLTDMLSVIVTTSFRNNGGRRFMEPYLLDKYGDRGTYFGQKITGDNNGVQGSGAYNDPEWNAMADPRWSPNGRQIVIWQALASPPACGGTRQSQLPRPDRDIDLP
ncbi:hypothetical protein DL95DRAFT_448830 [Leptodontidium sp. 2 PMI_412]|nr:hypothetical protein DL95DRAFT_448830 [Leptodontidium sp. 2 PMI_412]